MNSTELRKSFLDFFASKQHLIMPSASMVVKNDPTLMYTNAGMNQFKDIFLGNISPEFKRVANTQKCLRVTGKHNDLEEVGKDTYHHTMFEMLGNWSFGDYFKKEAIDWAFEFLTVVLKIPVDRLYVTYFEGSTNDCIEADHEVYDLWKKYFPEERIIRCSKKDNFWEMGDIGPCGPCSEIHVDLRDENDRKIIEGCQLVNKNNPLVIEIWNLVFIQYNRKADNSLELLPDKHVDTGMGFERLCMVVQDKKSNYDTDVFQPLIQFISNLCNIEYEKNAETDIAMRVISDHLRAVSFAIADGQLPSNNKAGYVIRRILRRAIRYGYTFLNFKEPFIFSIVQVLVRQMGDQFTELTAQQKLIENVIKEEENAFLKTLSTGINRFEQYLQSLDLSNNIQSKIDGKFAFELYDTYGFPIDLTQLLAKEKNIEIDIETFNKELEAQKSRSRNASAVETTDWVVLKDDINEEFVGYDLTEVNVYIVKYRKITNKSKEFYQVVLNKTPFYAESGGQVGDTGYLESISGKIEIIDTKSENNLIVHIVTELPENPENVFIAIVNKNKRELTENNHTATHLLHNALRNVLGSHVEQKGSLVNSEYLRFDFSHFHKLSDEELLKIEYLVNSNIRKNIELEENRSITIDEAKEKGAIALFGEKYGNRVRTVKFGESIELCGGTHVRSTGRIGYFKILSESAIAAGIRRIEAITSIKAEEFINEQLNLLKKIRSIFKNPKDLEKSIENLIIQNENLVKHLEQFSKEKIEFLKNSLLNKISTINNVKTIIEIVEIDSVNSLKDLAFQLKNHLENIIVVLGAEISGKASLVAAVSDDLVKSKTADANNLIKVISTEINGKGGGQSFLSVAGGTEVSGLEKALSKTRELLMRPL
jgi:alanyl-tRNA synthetase